MFMMVFSICPDIAGCSRDDYIRVISEPFAVELTLNADKRWELDSACDEMRAKVRLSLSSELREMSYSTLCVRQDLWESNN